MVSTENETSLDARIRRMRQATLQLAIASVEIGAVVHDLDQRLTSQQRAIVQEIDVLIRKASRLTERLEESVVSAS